METLPRKEQILPSSAFPHVLPSMPIPRFKGRLSFHRSPFDNSICS